MTVFFMLRNICIYFCRILCYIENKGRNVLYLYTAAVCFVQRGTYT